MASISVLMSVYQSDNPDYLKVALESVYKQSSLPEQVVIVKDGPISSDLEDIICQFATEAIVRTDVVPLKINVGLGAALNAGLKLCTSDWIMRMDSDDICRSDRIKIMLKEMKTDDYNHDVYGAYYEEFNQDNGEIYTRRVPLIHEDIVRSIGSRNPMNHVSVLINRESLLEVGGYKSFLWFEDYFLWVRMILAGKKLKNIPVVTVDVRVGNDMFRRRRGIKYVKQEFKMLRYLLSKNFVNYFSFAFNFVKRGGIRLLPVFCIRSLYKLERKVKK